MEQITPEAHGDQIKKERESIAASAILFKGKIYTGVTHGEAILKFEERFPNWKKMKIEDIIDGFVTNTGRFVERDEAGKIACDAGQLNHLPHDKQFRALECLDAHHILPERWTK